MPSPITLTYLADDHHIVAEGIASLLRGTGIYGEVRIFADGKSLWNACKTQQPQWVFLDYEMPGWSGLDTLQQLKAAYPHLPVLILSMNAEKSIIEACILHGANGYLSKDSAPDELMEALAEVQRGEVYYSRAVLKALAGLRTTRLATKTIQVDLSARETEILKLICDGLSPKEIADKLYLSKRTVDTHKTNIMQKFDVGSVGKLISIALQNNLLK
jgi:DNA-binding NarL/FixJ family response regulator